MSIQTTPSNEDIALGAKVISYSIQALGFIASLALSSMCSSAVITVLVALISTIVLTLLGAVAAFFITTAMDVKHIAYVGATTNSVMFKLGGLFRRKSAPITA